MELKVTVAYDEKENDVLGKIIKLNRGIENHLVGVLNFEENSVVFKTNCEEEYQVKFVEKIHDIAKQCFDISPTVMITASDK